MSPGHVGGDRVGGPASDQNRRGFLRTAVGPVFLRAGRRNTVAFGGGVPSQAQKVDHHRIRLGDRRKSRLPGGGGARRRASPFGRCGNTSRGGTVVLGMPRRSRSWPLAPSGCWFPCTASGRSTAWAASSTPFERAERSETGAGFGLRHGSPITLRRARNGFSVGIGWNGPAATMTRSGNETAGGFPAASSAGQEGLALPLSRAPQHTTPPHPLAAPLRPRTSLPPGRCWRGRRQGL